MRLVCSDGSVFAKGDERVEKVVSGIQSTAGLYGNVLLNAVKMSTKVNR